jgi:hypothetical protein
MCAVVKRPRNNGEGGEFGRDLLGASQKVDLEIRIKNS